MLSKHIKQFIPPILFTLKRKLFASKKQAVWSGNYASWQEAEKLCTGYDSDVILTKCKEALLQVKNGNAVYERDSVLFNYIQYSWGLLAGLQKIALENGGALSVLDFGGSLGSTYYQNKSFLSSLHSFSWSIVEQPHFVECGKAFFANEQLNFYYTIDECLGQMKPQVLLLSGVLQYLPNPSEWLQQLNSSGCDYILIDRTTEISEGSIISIQQVPGEIYNASYPCWFFNNSFIKNELTNYQLIVSFPGAFDPINYKLNDAITANWKGYLYKKNK